MSDFVRENKFTVNGSGGVDVDYDVRVILPGGIRGRLRHLVIYLPSAEEVAEKCDDVGVGFAPP